MKFKELNPFRVMGYTLAYLQAYFDDTILYSIKKLQKKAEEENNPEKIKKIHEKIIYYAGMGLSKSIGEGVGGYYEKYKDLKNGDNLCETTFEKDIPRLRIKTKNLKTRLELKGVKKANLEDLKKLKNIEQTSTSEKIKIRLKTKRNELLKIQKTSLEKIEKLRNRKNIVDNSVNNKEDINKKKSEDKKTKSKK